MSANYDQVMTALRNADKAGDTAAAKRLAQIAGKIKAEPAPQPAATPIAPQPNSQPGPSAANNQKIEQWQGAGAIGDTKAVGAIVMGAAGEVMDIGRSLSQLVDAKEIAQKIGDWEGKLRGVAKEDDTEGFYEAGKVLGSLVPFGKATQVAGKLGEAASVGFKTPVGKAVAKSAATAIGVGGAATAITPVDAPGWEHSDADLQTGDLGHASYMDVLKAKSNIWSDNMLLSVGFDGLAAAPGFVKEAASRAKSGVDGYISDVKGSPKEHARAILKRSGLAPTLEALHDDAMRATEAADTQQHLIMGAEQRADQAVKAVPTSGTNAAGDVAKAMTGKAAAEQEAVSQKVNEARSNLESKALKLKDGTPADPTVAGESIRDKLLRKLGDLKEARKKAGDPAYKEAFARLEGKVTDVEQTTHWANAMSGIVRAQNEAVGGMWSRVSSQLTTDEPTEEAVNDAVTKVISDARAKGAKITTQMIEHIIEDVRNNLKEPLSPKKIENVRRYLADFSYKPAVGAEADNIIRAGKVAKEMRRAMVEVEPEYANAVATWEQLSEPVNKFRDRPFLKAATKVSKFTSEPQAQGKNVAGRFFSNPESIRDAREALGASFDAEAYTYVNSVLAGKKSADISKWMRDNGAVLEELGPGIRADVGKLRDATAEHEAALKGGKYDSAVTREINNLLVNGETQHASDIVAGLIMPRAGREAHNKGATERAFREIVKAVGGTQAGQRMLGGAVMDALTTMVREDPAKFAEQWGQTRKLLESVPGGLDKETLKAYDDVAQTQFDLQKAREVGARYEAHIKDMPQPIDAVRTPSGELANPKLKEEFDSTIKRIRKRGNLNLVVGLTVLATTKGFTAHALGVVLVGTKYLPVVMHRLLRGMKEGDVGDMSTRINRSLNEIARDPEAVRQMNKPLTKERIGWLAKQMKQSGLSEIDAERWKAMALAIYADQLEDKTAETGAQHEASR
jgi:hypothetical protein